MLEKGKIFKNSGKIVQNFENILKKGRWLRAIIACNKLRENQEISTSNRAKKLYFPSENAQGTIKPWYACWSFIL